jgi:hypothetical protein
VHHVIHHAASAASSGHQRIRQPQRDAEATKQGSINQLCSRGNEFEEVAIGELAEKHSGALGGKAELIAPEYKRRVGKEERPQIADGKGNACERCEYLL